VHWGKSKAELLMAPALSIVLVWKRKDYDETNNYYYYFPIVFIIKVHLALRKYKAKVANT